MTPLEMAHRRFVAGRIRDLAKKLIRTEVSSRPEMLKVWRPHDEQLKRRCRSIALRMMAEAKDIECGRNGIKRAAKAKSHPPATISP